MANYVEMVRSNYVRISDAGRFAQICSPSEARGLTLKNWKTALER